VGALERATKGTHEGCPYNYMETYASPRQRFRAIIDLGAYYDIGAEAKKK